MLFLMTIITLSFACNNGHQTGGNELVQHDTIRKNSKVTITTSGSIIKTGEYIKHYDNGVIEMRGMMKDGKREGLWKSWYQNGAPWSETTFTDGMKNGKTTTWYENEQKRYEGFFTNDVESGKWIFWNEKGNVVNKKDYEKKP